jgi:ribosomal protein S18 acetylase RimI-like enzyme
MREFYAEAGIPLDEVWAGHAFEILVQAPQHGAVWLIESDGEAIGHVVLSIRFAMEFGGFSGYIDDLFVRPAYRRRGAASVGLNALLAECRQRGCHSVHVEVGTDNHAAQMLYRRYGLVAGDDQRQALRVVLPPAG